jgi:ATP-dependent RNA helicase DeaD
MLSMGFLEDITWILDQSPSHRQTALFSATMPKAIKGIAQRYLKDPLEVVVKRSSSTEALISQAHWVVSGLHKLDALTRILETGEVDRVLVFARTKTATTELAEKLEARGYSAAALNGDLNQEARERTIGRLKAGKLDVVVATDVAARGIHVDRISHVVNYDIPFDAETYTHRIGRTGRAGRSGMAIMFVSPREIGLMRSIERVTGKKIPPFKMPTKEDLAARRVDRFVSKVDEVLKHTDLEPYHAVIESLLKKTGGPIEHAAAAMCALIHQETPLFIDASVAELPSPPDASYNEPAPKRRVRSEPRQRDTPRDSKVRRRKRDGDEAPRRSKRTQPAEHGKRSEWERRKPSHGQKRVSGGKTPPRTRR